MVEKCAACNGRGFTMASKLEWCPACHPVLQRYTWFSEGGEFRNEYTATITATELIVERVEVYTGCFPPVTTAHEHSLRYIGKSPHGVYLTDVDEARREVNRMMEPEEGE